MSRGDMGSFPSAPVSRRQRLARLPGRSGDRVFGSRSIDFRPMGSGVDMGLWRTPYRKHLTGVRQELPQQPRQRLPIRMDRRSPRLTAQIRPIGLGRPTRRWGLTTTRNDSLKATSVRHWFVVADGPDRGNVAASHGTIRACVRPGEGSRRTSGRSPHGDACGRGHPAGLARVPGNRPTIELPQPAGRAVPAPGQVQRRADLAAPARGGRPRRPDLAPASSA